MKKALGQTVRDLKRGVNKKVLKVPSIEQKVLDATSNEPWGPHGTLLADIALASRNYHEYQMIMSVVWKRINDTGKNWRHVYKALTVLEYLVAHGSERVIDEIREHAYQISTLSDFQYIDSSGRDQGNNVRKKSQGLVVLVNDKERIQEVRQKAASNREKYNNTSAGSMYRPGSGGYGDKYDDRSEGRYGSDERNGFERERELGKYGDSDERYGRDGYRDDDYRGRSPSADDYNYGSRSRSVDPDRGHSYEDDGQYSSRGSGAKPDDHSQDGSTSSKTLERKYSEQNLGAPPPSYEEAVDATQSPTNSDRDRESSVAHVPNPSAIAGASPSHAAGASPPFSASPPAQATAQDSKEQADDFDEFDPRGSFTAVSTNSNGNAPATTGNAEMDLLGSLSESFSSNSLALVPANEPDVAHHEATAPESFSSGHTFAANSSPSQGSNQPFDDPFGDGPFRAIPSADSITTQQQIAQSSNFTQPAPQHTTDFGDSLYTNSDVHPPPTNPQVVQQEQSVLNSDFDILADILPPSTPPSLVNTQSGYPIQPSQSPTAEIAPHNSFQAQAGQPSGFPSQPGQPTGLPTQPGQPTGFPTQPGQHSGFPVQPGQHSGFPAQPGQPSGFPTQPGQPSGFPTQPGQHSGFPTQPGQHSGFMIQPGQPSGYQTQHGHPSGFPQPGQPSLHANYHLQSADSIPQNSFTGQSMALTYPVQASQTGTYSQNGQSTAQTGYPSHLSRHSAQPNLPPNSNYYGAYNSQQNFTSQPNAVPVSSQMGSVAVTAQASTGSSAIIPQPSKDKFETKSTVWADTLSRGLVNLNISGSKTNPLNDIGVDFDAINRKDKRMEKPTTAAVTSTVTMGKAMGSGSGMGRAGAGALRPQPNPMMGSGMNIVMAGSPRAGMSMGGGYGVNQSMGMGINMPGNMGMAPGMNMPGNMGMAPGMNMPGNMGMGPGMNVNMGYMGQGGVHMQQPTGFNPSGPTNIPGGYNPMAGSGNYGHQPYGGGYR